MIVALTALPAGVAAASGDLASNSATIEMGDGPQAAAVCQVVVLVNSLLVVQAEDKLGLVTSALREPVTLSLPASGGGSEAVVAECSVLLKKLRIVDGTAEGLAASRGSYVSGPSVVSEEARSVLENRVRLQIAGTQSSAAVCQLIVLVNSVVLGGSLLGLSPGYAPSVMRFANEVSEGSRESARCSALVHEVEIA